MKINRADPKFVPVTITLDTAEELELLQHFFQYGTVDNEVIKQSGREREVIKRFSNKVFDELEGFM